jgi:cyclophilin family peptidyl-prolyl cis-trans isomerase
MRTTARFFLLLLTAGACLGLPSAREDQLPPVQVTLEIEGGAAYHKRPLVLALVFNNRVEPRLQLDAAAFAPEAFTIVDESGKPARRAGTPAPAAEPLVVDGYGTGRRAIDLSAWYPDLGRKKNKVWMVAWSHGGLSTGPFRVKIIPPHDPARDRQAVVETSLGRMTWNLLPGQAPQHVKRFVDLARQGYYDGMTIFRVIPGIQAEGGDPKGDGTGAWEKMQPPEIAKPNLPMGVGLIGSSRQETSMTSDTMFFITLGPSDFMKGFQTFFARLSDGMEVLGKLQGLPSKGGTGMRDAFLLDQPVTITRITIR